MCLLTVYSNNLYSAPRLGRPGDGDVASTAMKERHTMATWSALENESISVSFTLVLN